jgi:DNA-binding CsgD family transcriptional regulator
MTASRPVRVAGTGLYGRQRGGLEDVTAETACGLGRGEEEPEGVQGQQAGQPRGGGCGGAGQDERAFGAGGFPAARQAEGERGEYDLLLFRGPGPDFSDRDRALLVLLRPHLQQAYLDAERRRRPVPRLTRRQNELLCLLAAGHTNTQIARRLGISEGTVRTHLENNYQKLGVSSRTAAVTRAFADRIAEGSAAG